MPKDKADGYFDAFAWLIYKEVERYINDHPAEFTKERRQEPNEQTH